MINFMQVTPVGKLQDITGAGRNEKAQRGAELLKI
jgi:hypothetical protein